MTPEEQYEEDRMMRGVVRLSQVLGSTPEGLFRMDRIERAEEASRKHIARFVDAQLIDDLDRRLEVAFLGSYD